MIQAEDDLPDAHEARHAKKSKVVFDSTPHVMDYGTAALRQEQMQRHHAMHNKNKFKSDTGADFIPGARC